MISIYGRLRRCKHSFALRAEKARCKRSVLVHVTLRWYGLQLKRNLSSCLRAEEDTTIGHVVWVMDDAGVEKAFGLPKDGYVNPF